MKRYALGFIILLCTSLFSPAQSSGRLEGKVQDATGAVIPHAHLTVLSGASAVAATESSGDGAYAFTNLAPGSYDLTVEAQGFAAFAMPRVTVDAGKTKQLRVTLRPGTEEQITITAQTSGVSLDADANTNSTVLKSKDLDALSDDPDALQSQLQALAGPAAGPDGGQLYIDGYTGGQLPPKSSILEVRINQNPFSAENDRIGYGRIDIITKPGAVKLGGHVRTSYLNSALDTSNPLASVQPNYQFYAAAADITGPITKTSSYFFASQYWQRQNQNFLRAVDPTDASANPRVLSQALAAPYSTLTAYGRADAQAGKHLLQAQWVLYRAQKTGQGTGGLDLPDQAYSLSDLENTFQFRDTDIVSSHFVNELSARWLRIRSNQTPDSLLPTVTVQGSFTTGGSPLGRVVNHQDNLELHDYATVTAGAHALRIGALARSYRIADYTTSGSNGSYQFASLTAYHAANPQPYLYTETVIGNPLARLLQFDGALFVQDEWRWKPTLNLSAGLRAEGQNRVRDHLDWAPRLALAWSPHASGSAPPKTVLHAAAGIFYNRFTPASQLQTIHNNGFFQQNYVLTNPTVYDPGNPLPISLLLGSPDSKPSIDTLDSHFHIARDTQTAIGIDRSLGKLGSVNLNYLYTRGTHQYFTNNVNAPAFDPSTYQITGPPPAVYNYQFQSGGDFRQHQLILTSNTTYRKISVHAVYTFNHARTDTQGVNFFPSVASDPSLDYGRANFASTHQLQAFATYNAPFRFLITAFAVAQSGRPYNITIGDDLTGNNQSNARPTYGTCGAASVITTALGCFDTAPEGKGEKIVPYGLGTGPANAVLSMTVNRVFHFGKASAAEVSTPNKQTPPRYTLTVIAGATNVLNMVNLAPPNGVLSSPLFGQQLTPAGGPFTLSSPGNRTVFVTSYFSF
jgi:hypothetical protein